MEMGKYRRRMGETKLPLDDSLRRIKVPTLGFDRKIYLIGDWEDTFGQIHRCRLGVVRHSRYFFERVKFKTNGESERRAASQGRC
mmetsp:Transcript_25172/g.52185  ORF Transcript_25172/g.52185 Transcript_25172/m.52185 type:complete len:85 (+) Transcript_25172:1182-1436(+)